MNQYRDMKLDETGDVVFSNDGDLLMAKGEQVVAQDVRTEAMLSPGDCFWAPNFGKGLRDALKGPEMSDIGRVLRKAALNDPRIAAESIETKTRDNGIHELSFWLLSGEATELTFPPRDES